VTFIRVYICDIKGAMGYSSVHQNQGLPQLCHLYGRQKQMCY